MRFAPLDLVLSDTNVVQLDYLIVSNQRQHIIAPDSIRGAPGLVVEILSPSTASRDWRIKLDPYAEYRAQEYWVVDPDAQCVWVMARSDEDPLVEVGNYARGDTLKSPALLGFTVSLDEMF